ncbi:MAG: HPF/RaiA family ribosome-associated protein [Proteobacteria bacterium]|nr:HPF/RaiA family ribosome-associated protein [Pseudomonadota bacterium]
MQIPVQVSFRHLEYSPYIARAVKKRARALQKYYPRITSLRVLVEPSAQKHTRGNLYHIRIDLTLPGKEVVVSRDPTLHHAHEDIYVAIRDAFRAARRQVEDHVRRNFRKKDTALATLGPDQGRITRIFPNEGCGFITTLDGREIYFHENSVVGGGFAALSAGSPVRFVESMGEKGPQASTVQALS